MCLCSFASFKNCLLKQDKVHLHFTQALTICKKLHIYFLSPDGHT